MFSIEKVARLVVESNKKSETKKVLTARLHAWASLLGCVGGVHC